MRAAVVAVLSVLPVLTLSAQQTPPRDPPAPRDAAGTAVIRGRVLAADSGQPIRRANVTLMPIQRVSGPAAVPLRPLQAVTDQGGAFEFARVPAGSYRLMAIPSPYSGQYLGISYGAARPVGPGSPDLGKTIELADGQVFDKVNIALPRGGVITGRVTDESGMPLARVQVYGLFFPPGTPRGTRSSAGMQTDDLGQFRIFGLQPGDYAVVAEARPSTYLSPASQAQAAPDDDRTGYLTTYYPATPDEAAAQRVRVAAARELSGIEIRIVSGRLYRVSGTVVDSQGQPVPNAMGQVVHRMPGGSGMSSFGFSTDPQGRFQMQNIPAGDYRLVVRQRPIGPPVNGQPPEPGEMAFMPLTIEGADVENLLVTTAPGTTITGRVVFEPVPPDPASLGTQPPRVFVTTADPGSNFGLPTPPAAVVQPDQSFTMKGLMGEYLLRMSLPQPTWYVKSVTAGGEDVLDTPRAFKTSDDVTIVVSTRAATLEGTVTDAKGEPATDAAVVLFGVDKSTWRSNSVWTRRMSVADKGQFRMTGLRPGRYYVLAVPRDRMNALNTAGGGNDPALFEEFTRDATSIVINEDEQRAVDLHLVTSGG